MKNHIVTLLFSFFFLGSYTLLSQELGYVYNTYPYNPLEEEVVKIAYSKNGEIKDLYKHWGAAKVRDTLLKLYRKEISINKRRHFLRLLSKLESPKLPTSFFLDQLQSEEDLIKVTIFQILFTLQDTNGDVVGNLEEYLENNGFDLHGRSIIRLLSVIATPASLKVLLDNRSLVNETGRLSKEIEFAIRRVEGYCLADDKVVYLERLLEKGGDDFRWAVRRLLYSKENKPSAKFLKLLSIKLSERENGFDYVVLLILRKYLGFKLNSEENSLVDLQGSYGC